MHETDFALQHSGRCSHPTQPSSFYESKKEVQLHNMWLPGELSVLLQHRRTRTYCWETFMIRTAYFSYCTFCLCHSYIAMSNLFELQPCQEQLLFSWLTKFAGAFCSNLDGTSDSRANFTIFHCKKSCNRATSRGYSNISVNDE